MDNDPEKQAAPQLEGDNSLEASGTVVDSGSNSADSAGPAPEAANEDGAVAAPPADNPGQPPAEAPKKPNKFSLRAHGLLRNLNIYLLIFGLLVLLAVVASIVAYQRNRQQEEAQIITQELTEETLEELRGSDAVIGDPKFTLSIESNAIFAGKVLIQDSLDVAGSIRVGGTMTLPGITVSGTSSFDQVQANSLQVASNASVEGTLAVQNGLTVTGGGTFSGPISAPQITIDTLQINRDLQINRHIDAGGSTPTKTDGSALGSGGTSSVSGTDTAGTVTINTGSNPGAGCFITVRFANAFAGTPHVVITPVGSAAAGLNYYINRNTSSFSVCSTSAPPAGASFSFDFVAID